MEKSSSIFCFAAEFRHDNDENRNSSSDGRSDKVKGRKTKLDAEKVSKNSDCITACALTKSVLDTVTVWKWQCPSGLKHGETYSLATFTCSDTD